MMLRYFGLKEDPFGVTPEPRCLFYSSTHREALASLKYAFDANRGFTALIASPGMGKTTLLYRFLEDIRPSSGSAFLFDIDSRCEPRELVAYILRDIGIAPGETSAEMHEQLNRALETHARAGRKFALVIDEAQNLSDSALETVRLLTNFETQQAKLIHVVLSGQPQLSEKLMAPSLTQLRQRIATICRLEPLSEEETRAYIGHRLKYAGHRGEPLFSEHALGLIFEESKGIPRTINNLCFNSLSICRAMRSKQVSGAMVAEAITDLELPLHSKPETLKVITSIAVPKVDEVRSRRWTRLTKFRVLVLMLLWAVSMLGVFELSKLGNEQFHWSPLPKHALESKTYSPANSVPTVADYSVQRAAVRSAVPVSFEVIVAPHDTLRDIAVRYLGDFSPARLHQIQELNPEITNPDHIEVGQNILLPGRPAVPSAENAMFQTNARNLP